MAYFRTEGFVSEWVGAGANREPTPKQSSRVSALRKGGTAPVYLFAQYLKDRVDSKKDDAAKVAELDRVLKLLLTEHLLVVQVVSDPEALAPS